MIAIDPATGEQKWKFEMTDVTDSGILTTASDLLFTGGREGYFQALDARTGALLWKTNLGAPINSGPITYRVGSKRIRLGGLRTLAVRVRARRVTTSGFRLKPEATCEARPVTTSQASFVFQVGRRFWAFEAL